MPLQDLHDTLATIRERIAAHGTHISAVEQRTRQLLVEPLLTALGWDLTDPAQVELRPRMPFTHAAGVPRADYALRNAQRRLAYVQVRSLGSPAMPQTLDQLLDHAANTGITHCVSTDGDTWTVFDVSGQDHPTKRESVEFRITRDRLVQCALGAFAVWRANINDATRPVSAEEPRIAVPRPTPQPLLDRRRTAARGTFDLSDARLKVTRHSPPSMVIDHTGRSSSTRSWIGFLIAVVNGLIDDHRITRADCPLKVNPGSSLCLINTTPTHPSGRPFKTPKQLQGGLYLEGDRFVKDCYHYARILLEYAGIPLTAVKFSIAGR